MNSLQKQPIRIVIADGSLRARNGLRAILTAQQGIDVIGEASQGNEALSIVAAQTPDVVLLDACLPMLDGAETTHAIKAHCQKVRVIVISLYSDHQAEALAAGADMFLIKGCPSEELIAAVRSKSIANNHLINRRKR